MRTFHYAAIFFAAITLSTAPGWHRQGSAHAESDKILAAETGETAVPGTVEISPSRRQKIGVKVALVEKKPMVHTFRALGRIEADETRVYRINASTDGWITSLNYNPVGSLVKKNEILATFTNPQFIDTIQNYLFAIDTVERLGLHERQELGRKEAPTAAAFDPFVLQRQMDALRSMGMNDKQLEEIGSSRKLQLDIQIVSPVEGFITARKVSVQERFLKGNELYRIEDLSKVWVLADVYEQEAELFQPGMKATVMAPYHQRTYEAVVTEILPVFDKSTRTLKVRLEVDNPGYKLRTDMFVDVDLPVTYPPAIWVPAGTVLDSGLRQTVFVDQGDGYFAPRRVRLGLRIGDQVEIVDGLAAGEHIVTSGNFLIDSESRMELAAMGEPFGMSRDPVCDQPVSEAKAAREGRTEEYLGKTYFFSSDDCKSRFAKEPKKYIAGE